MTDFSKVVNCYAMVNTLFTNLGCHDMTEGMYNNNPDLSYEEAQAAQSNYLLDQIGCKENSTILDIGCGYGPLLQHAQNRKAKAMGITLSPQQLAFCQKKGFDVRLLNYRNLTKTEEFIGRFDAVVANGSLEHFVQPEEAAKGEGSEVYRQLFEIVRQVIDPESASRRFVTTAIHFVRDFSPKNVRRSPFLYKWGSDEFHYSLMLQSFGGWYPYLGQLESCARGKFRLVEEVDGTEDYRITSEEWLRRAKVVMSKGSKVGTILKQMLPVIFGSPIQSVQLFICVFCSESWNWQFRGKNPPTRLLRQTWEML